MLRLMGILTGSAIAVAFLIVALGVPDFSAQEPEQKAVADVSQDLVAAAAPEPAPDLLAVPVSEPQPAPVEEPEPAPVKKTEPEGHLEQHSDPDTEALIDQIFNPGPEDLIEENWYAFWSPFRSEIAARGFVAKLQETTGIDYRVVKVKTGVYEVAFAYDDDADIQEKLARISSATGLNMTDS